VSIFAEIKKQNAKNLVKPGEFVPARSSLSEFTEGLLKAWQAEGGKYAKGCVNGSISTASHQRPFYQTHYNAQNNFKE